jgi:antitoxin MazE
MHVSKWGRSLAIRLPKALVESLGLAEGDDVEIVEAAKDRIALLKVDWRDEALERMAGRGWSAPANYKFNG